MPRSQAARPSPLSLQLGTGKHYWGLDIKGSDSGLGSLLNCRETEEAAEIIWALAPSFEKCIDPQGIGQFS